MKYEFRYAHLLDHFLFCRTQMGFYVIHLKGLGGKVSSYRDVCDTAGNERRDSHRETKDGVRANSEIR